MKIEDYFEYWNEFFNIWKKSKTKLEYEKGILSLNKGFRDSPFNYPEGLMNCDCESNETFEYIPEPYWGWTPEKRTKLKMVVVNYNPASGGPIQHINSANVQSIKSYSEYVAEQLNDFIIFRKDSKKPKLKNKPIQYETTKWHYTNRANKLIKVIDEKYSNDDNSECIDYYLGIDLVPWHTKNVTALNGYLQQNFSSIKMWSLNFAMEASKNVIGLLQNKVIVRTNLTTFKELFRNEFDSGFFKEDIKYPKEKKPNNDNFQKIAIKDQNDIAIYLLWGKRNSLPTTTFLKEIFTLK
jgi:hypothetical protein